MLADKLRAAPSYRALAAKWRKSRQGLHWGGLWGSSKALLSAALGRDLDAPLLVVVPDGGGLELALDDLQTCGASALPFPAREGRLGVEAEVLRERFHALDLANRDGFNGVLVAPLAALIQPVPAAGDGAASFELRQGMSLTAEALLKRLLDAGFERVPAIGATGEMALRGDILDFYAAGMGEPLRLEFFEDVLESIRVFDLATQRTRHVLKHARVPLVHELPEVAAAGDPLPLERMPKRLRVVQWEPELIGDAARRLRLLSSAHAAALDRLERGFKNSLRLATLPGEDGTLDVLSVEEYCRGVADGAVLLAQRAAAGEAVTVCCSSEAEADRLAHLLAERKLDPKLLDLRQGGLERGFRVVEAGLTVIHHRELIPGHGAHRPRPRRRPRHDTAVVESAAALHPGDLVIHAVHGLARFQGFDTARPSPGSGAVLHEGEQDVLVLEFAEGALLHVPVARIDLVERYIGAGGSLTPELDRLGSGAFERRRRKVQAAVEDMAAELLEVQARRLSQAGLSFAATPEQRQFSASFPWEDTPDQAQGTREIEQDLAAARAMDRLLCGDVGYGKTELAARAAFQVIAAGHQVAVLVPTTVLCEQHYASFRERFADWPVTIAQISRIRPPAERRAALKGLADGSIDLVVGTHRLLSKDVRFRKLGLVVIDEEQRFGVRAKEDLKRKRAQVDILSLSATPIPRTLHMALAGLRDITSLSTAPPGRLEIHTEIRYREEDDLIAEALQRELDRGGQAFFVHNRIASLEAVANRLRRLVPKTTVVTGHGQMDPELLEKTMVSFVRGTARVLCCTTIVESGLDIPNANTILIDNAQNYGLADLHQLRGRVGRSPRRAWCYLLIPKGQPLPRDARRRLKAVEELRYLGAGFQIAMRDLEIRGAGNLLGAEQSGHIAAVGYETYRRLLAQAVARLKRLALDQETTEPRPAADLQLGVKAALPPEYIAGEEARLDILRELDQVRSPAAVDAALAAVRDRFGPPPEEVAHLARLFYLKHRLGEMGLDAVHWVDDRLICTVRDMRRLERALQPAGIELRVITPRQAHWVLPRGVRQPAAILEHLYQTAAACRPAPGARQFPARISRS